MANGETPIPPSEQVTNAPTAGPPPAGEATGIQAADAAADAASPLAPIPQPPPSPERLLARVQVLDGLLVVLVLAFAFLVASFPANNTDLFQHLAAGRLIAEGAYPFGSDPFTFGSEGAYWANHPWLFDLLSYLVYRVDETGEIGGVLLVVLKALLVLLLAAVMLRTASRPGQRLWIPAVCVLLAVLALSPALRLQPAVVGMLLLALVVCLLEGRAGEDVAARARRWWLVPVVCLAWVNLDDWFLLGPAVVALYLLGAWLQTRFPTESAEDGPAPPLARLGLVLAASV